MGRAKRRQISLMQMDFYKTILCLIHHLFPSEGWGAEQKCEIEFKIQEQWRALPGFLGGAQEDCKPTECSSMRRDTDMVGTALLHVHAEQEITIFFVHLSVAWKGPESEPDQRCLLLEKRLEAAEILWIDDQRPDRNEVKHFLTSSYWVSEYSIMCLSSMDR